MKVKYLGPRLAVEVSPYGTHRAGEIKDYPEAFARDLAASSSRQRFELAAEPDPAPPLPVKQAHKRKTKRSKTHES